MKKRSEMMDKKIKKEMRPLKRQEKGDREFVASLKKDRKPAKAIRVLKKDIKAGEKELKVKKVMREYKKGELHEGSKKGPIVSNRKQAIAIALSEGRKAAKKPVRRSK